MSVHPFVCPSVHLFVLTSVCYGGNENYSANINARIQIFSLIMDIVILVLFIKMKFILIATVQKKDC